MKEIKILAIGDVSGPVGRRMIKKYLQRIINEENIDFTIVNGENTTNGRSLSYKHYLFLKQNGADVITSGNHIFDLREIKNYIDDVDDLLRPLNYPEGVPGIGTNVFKCKNFKIRVTNLIGQAFMAQNYDNPFSIFNNLLEDCAPSDFHIVDFHGETTSEKICFAWNYDSKINIFFGTHTHVQTADERILPLGTGFITDLGFTGAHNSALGVKIEPVIYKLKTQLPQRFIPAEGVGQICGAIFTLDVESKKTFEIKRIFIIDELQN